MCTRNYFLWVTALILNSYICFSQDDTTWKQILNSKISSLEKSRKLDSIINTDRISRDSTLERLTHKYAVWLQKNKNLDKAISVAKQSLEIKQKYYAIDTTLVQHGYYNVAFFLYKNKQIEESIRYYQNILSIDPTTSYASRAYSELGRCYKATGDYYNAIAHFELAQSIFEKNKNYKRIIINAINVHKCYIELENPESFNKAIKNLKIADSLSQIINSRLSTRYNIKIALGTVYNQNKNLDREKALFYYQEALQIAKKTKDTQKILGTYQHIGNLYNTFDPNKGIQFQKLSLPYIKQNDSTSYFISYSNIAFCFVQKNDIEEGRTYYNKATQFIPKKKNIAAFNDSNKFDLLSLFMGKANTYLKLYQTSKNESLLGSSIENFSKADQLIDLIRIESREFKSKLYWRQKSSKVYGRAIEACFLANDKEKAFYFMEKNKALLLSENILESKRKQSVKLPEKIISKETELRKKIYLLEKDKETTSEEKKIDAITIEIFKHKRILKTLQDSIQNNFSEYRSFDMQLPLTNLQNVQKSLDDHTVILEYNISKDIEYGPTTNADYKPIVAGSSYGEKSYTKGYVLCITNNETYFRELQYIDNLEQNVKRFIHKASLPFKNENDVLSYTKIGYEVFNTLFPTKEIQEVIKNKQLRIIPDNYLNYIPFEALVTSSDSKIRPKYLIEESEISYGYSNSFLNNLLNTLPISKKKISSLGLAPNTFKKLGLAPLENSMTEVSNVYNLFSGETFTNQKASKKQFLDRLQYHNIIHLATHADAMDSISPWIGFSDEKLNLDELYLTKNKADLVVLSGCNTLLGQQEIGEGVMSLARGFFHSGAKSVVSSLWNVDDRSTAYIMDHFYKNLKNQQTKPKALREAKLSYLKNSSLSESSPHYWATFVLLGDSSPIVSSSFISTYWLFLLISIGIILLWVFRPFKKK